MPTDTLTPFEPLALADPDLAQSVAERLACKPGTVEADLTDRLIADTLWAHHMEASFGRAVALGYAAIAGEAPAEGFRTYHRWLRNAGGKGPTLGRILAECLPPVLVHGDGETLRRFEQAWDAMARIGAHALGEPLRGLSYLLTAGEQAAAHFYLDLLHTIFASEPSYEEVRYFSIALPAAVRQLPPQRRHWQLREINAVARLDRRLVEPFLSGLSRGLGRLGETALRNVVAAAMHLAPGDRSRAARWLALESAAAQERFDALQVSVGFGQVHGRLRRYLHARTGLALSIRPLSALAGSVQAPREPGRMVCSDSQAIYLPEEVELFGEKRQNVELYQLLVRLEASFHEFGTFEFDGEKALEACRSFIGADLMTSGLPQTGRSEVEAFLCLFPDPLLAGELFAIFELGRIRKCLEQSYPGLVRRFYPLLRRAFRQTAEGDSGPAAFLRALAERLALGAAGCAGASLVEESAAAFDSGISAASAVEASAAMAARFFEPVRRQTGVPGGKSPLFNAPFGWRPWPNPAFAAGSPPDRLVEQIRAILAAEGLKAFRTDIRQRLKAGSGHLTPEDIRTLCAQRAAAAERLETILSAERGGENGAEGLAPEDGPVFRYPEWDERLGDYLPEHVRLRERMPPGESGDFYSDVLGRHDDLVRQTRKAFERLRPEGLKRLRGWLDGDEFDYRHLIEASVARRIGDTPSDRIFVKRVKDRREVAVLLLVDLSRSTANRVSGSEASVLEIEKEAIVILCEALTTLGDGLAIAGFSGSGRLGVDYFRIKAFDEPLSQEVKLRIGALRPHRNTRMGAAIRHSAKELAGQPVPVRLLMILSDGFPNDADYKGSHAVADTRKALAELNARGIRFHALTVNLPADPQLDRLYGKVRHHVVSDVRELPGRLLRVYGRLTR